TLVVVLVAAPAFGQTLSGYLQLDYVNSQESVDQLNDANAQPLNQDRFMVRRARVKLTDSWRYFEYAAELEINTVAGPIVAARQLEVAAHWPPLEDVPQARFTLPHLGAPPDAGAAPSDAAPAPPPDAGVADDDAGVTPAEPEPP